MPIYEYYCPDNHTIYQFYAKTLAQGKTLPKCPANAGYRMVKMLSPFAVTSGGKRQDAPPEHAVTDAPVDEARMEAAMSAMESEFSSIDENDPRAMARIMRRMAELSGEKIDGEMEEVVRKLEEGADPDALDEQLGGDGSESGEGALEDAAAKELKERRHRFRVRRAAPTRDPQLYDYD
jgi:hypothetical protein